MQVRQLLREWYDSIECILIVTDTDFNTESNHCHFSFHKMERVTVTSTEFVFDISNLGHLCEQILVDKSETPSGFTVLIRKRI